MQPRLAEGVFVFASLPLATPLPPGLNAIATIQEAEGLSLVLEESEAARAGIAGSYRCRMISLDIHSSLEAIGFLAVITTALADEGLGANTVSAFHHDHLFVAADEADRAMAVLMGLTELPAGITGLDHVQLAMPASGEDQARAFYIDLLGLAEEPKPASLAARGGLWLKGRGIKLHLGIEADFRPARKAHPALLTHGIEQLAERLAAAGIDTQWDQEIANVRRFFTADPFGNRIEFLAA